MAKAMPSQADALAADIVDTGEDDVVPLDLDNHGSIQPLAVKIPQASSRNQPHGYPSR